MHRHCGLKNLGREEREQALCCRYETNTHTCTESQAWLSCADAWPTDREFRSRRAARAVDATLALSWPLARSTELATRTHTRTESTPK